MAVTLLATGFVLAFGCGRTGSASLVPDAGATVPDDDRRILVTLKQSPAAPPTAAGSTSTTYVGPSEYRATERTRRLVRRLAREYALEELDAWPIQALSVHCVVFAVPGEAEVEDVMERIAAEPRVDSVQRMKQFELQGSMAATGSQSPTSSTSSTYNDPYVGMQHGPESLRVWQTHPVVDGRGITVAVVDSGVDRDHPDLEGSVEVARDFVGSRTRRGGPAEFHGTAIVGIIGSRPNNSLGTVGVAPAARIMALRACAESDGVVAAGCNSFTLAKALAFVADHPPDVLNLSISGPWDPLLARLVTTAVESGVIVVTTAPAASAEPGEIEEAARAFPASIEGVLIVGADRASVVADGPAPVLRAPGEEILTTVPGGAFDFVSGGSFATAHVSGVVALLLERAPQLTAADVRTLLHETSGARGPDGGMLVNACEAFARAVPDAPVNCSRSVGTTADTASGGDH